jgi:hypothetical protein
MHQPSTTSHIKKPAFAASLISLVSGSEEYAGNLNRSHIQGGPFQSVQIQFVYHSQIQLRTHNDTSGSPNPTSYGYTSSRSSAIRPFAIGEFVFFSPIAPKPRIGASACSWHMPESLGLYRSLKDTVVSIKKMYQSAVKMRISYV